jgi:hypothetical protein
MSAAVIGLCREENGIAGGKISMGSLVVAPKALVKTGLPDNCDGFLQALYGREP